MSRPLATLLCCALVLLAGCNGILGGPGPEPDREPYEVPQSHPPGVTNDTPVDADELVASHEDVVRSGSVTVRKLRVQRFVANDTRRYRARTVRREGASGRYVVQRVESREPLVLNATSVRIRGWENTTTQVVSLVANGTTRYERYSLGHGDVAHSVRLSLLFSALDPELAGTERMDGREVYVLRAERPTLDRGITRGSVRNASNVTLVAWVDQRGLVRRYRLTYVGTVDEGRVRVRETLRFEDLGSTTVPRPDWVDEAIAETCQPRSADPGCG